MKIKKELLNKRLNQIKETGFTVEINKWIKNRENSVGSNYYINEIEKHIQSLEDEFNPVDAYLPWTDDNNAEWGSLLAVTSAVLKSVGLNIENPKKKIKEDLIVTQQLVVYGDLIIEGDLSFETEENRVHLLVFGNLIVKGKISQDYSVMIVIGNIEAGVFDEESDWSVCVVQGTMKSMQYLHSSGELICFDTLFSPFIYLDYNHGFTLMLKGFLSHLLYISDHPDSCCFGNYKSECIFIPMDIIEGIETPEEIKSLRALEGILKPEFKEDFDFTGFEESESEFIMEYLEDVHGFSIFDFMDDLLDKTREGVSIFKESLLMKL